MSKKIAVSSLLMALSVVTLLLGSVLPVTAAMCFLASAITAVTVVECNDKYAAINFLGVSIISFLFIPKKSIVYFYIAFLGYYPILKLYIERLNNLLKEWIVKILFFNLLLVIAYFIIKSFFLPVIDKELIIFIFKYLAAILAVAEILFVIYDIGLTYFIEFYNNRIRKR